MSLTRPEAVTLALYALGGAEAPFDTEDVAVRVADVAPGMFAWKKYADRIDKELVRVALSDARLKKEWVVGSHDKGGWLLTPAGHAFAQSKESELGGVMDPRPSQRQENPKQFARERARLLTSSAHQQVLSDGDARNVTPNDADAFFRISVYVHGQGRERKIARVENLFGDDPDLGITVKLLATIARARTEP